MNLQNQTALVTGGGSGIGLGIAAALAAEGCRVAIAGRGAERLKAAVAGCPCQPPLRWQTCDVADRAQVERLFAWFAAEIGPLDILVNSAGINVRNRRMADLDPADWDRMMAVNANGTYYCMRAALPEMRRRQSGLIVNVCSVAGRRALRLAGPAYCASKFAVAALGTAASSEERPNGVRITTIFPGEVNTPILAQRPEPVPSERLAQMLQPEDLGALVVALAKLPPRVVVPEVVVTPLYQEFV